MDFSELLEKNEWKKEELVRMLLSEGEEQENLFRKAHEVKLQYVGNKVFFRGLIEFSNICSKDCLYCGIRKGNDKVTRYNLSDQEIISAADFAYKKNYGSLVIQGGEIDSPAFTERIEKLLKEIKKRKNIEAVLLYDTLDFEQKEWKEDKYNNYILKNWKRKLFISYNLLMYTGMNYLKY